LGTPKTVILSNPLIYEAKMRNSTSILSLVLALGIYAAGPVITKFGPFAATAALADSDDGGTGGSDDSGGDSDDDGDSGSDGSDDGSDGSDDGSDGSDDGSDGSDDGDDSDDDDSSALSEADDDLVDDDDCTINCKVTIKKN
jgi:hypothetical protein